MKRRQPQQVNAPLQKLGDECPTERRDMWMFGGALGSLRIHTFRHERPRALPFLSTVLFCQTFAFALGKR